ncbi:hypothetical protein GW17_00053503 [Ensete ventricosum]|nr:hypothetical protein GW17_00053503 [Ensete ventricosum]
MAKHRAIEQDGQAEPLPQTIVGEMKCKLALKLLETLMKSTTMNKTSEKLGILREWRRCNLERQPKIEAMRRDLQRRKPATMFLKRVWRNSTKANKGSSR